MGIIYEQISLASADGTVHAIYNGAANFSVSLNWTSAGVAGVSVSNRHLSGLGPSTVTEVSTQYYHEDHLGTSRVMTTASGWPVWQGTFAPFGQEVSPQITTNHYKFTGKERDSESNLDYFGARYMSSSMGRFMQPDPKQFSLRTLVNPQKWNKYSYVLNNPLSLFDPDGMEEMTVTYRAFIPTATASVAGFTYRGDNRGFSTASNASSRISISVRVETDPQKAANPLIGKPVVSVGTTERMSPLPATATATSGLPTAQVSRDGNGNVMINVQADAKNPLGPPQTVLGQTIGNAVEPGIKPDLNVTIPPSGSSATVTGTTSGFPAQEINATEGDTTTPLFQFMPPSTSPTELFKTIDVNKTTQLPQCGGDKKACSN